MLNYILLACIARLLIRLSTRIYEILKTYNEFSSLINLASNEDSCVRREAIEKLCELTSDKNPPSAKVHEILEVFTAAANDVHVNTKQNALRGIITLIEKDKLLEDKIEDVFKLFVAESSNTSDNVKAHALSGINKLVEKDKLSIAKTEEVLNLFIIGVSGAFGVRKNALFGIWQLIEKDRLLADEVESALEQFIIGAKDTKFFIRKISLSGITSLICKNKLLESQVERILDFLEERINIESDDKVRHLVIIAIKRLLEETTIPENKVEKILNLLIAKKESGILLFKDITDEEREEIATIIDGTIIEKLKAICTSITFFIEQARNGNNEVKAAALQRIAVLINEGRVSTEKVDKILTLLMVKAKERCATVKANALSGINELIEKNKLPAEKIEGILGLFITEVRSDNSDIRLKAILGIDRLIERNHLRAAKIKEVLDLFIALGRDANDDIRVKTIFGISLLIERNKLPADEIDEVVELLIAGATDTTTRKNAMFGIRELIKQDKLPTAKMEEITDLLIAGAEDTKIDIRKNALLSISKLIEQGKLLESKSEEILTLFITRASNNITKKNAIFEIKELIKQDKLPAGKIEAIMNLFMAVTNDADADIRNNVLLGIIILIEKNKIPQAKKNDVINVFIVCSRDIDTYVKKNALFGTVKLVEKEMLPIERVEEVLALFIVEANNVNADVRMKAQSGIGYLLEENRLTKEKIEEIFDLFVAGAKDIDIDVRNYVLLNICKIIEKGSLALTKIEEISILFIESTKDITTKKNAIFGIKELINHDQLFVGTLHIALDIFIAGANDEDTDIVNNILFGIIELIKKEQLPIEKTEEVLILLIEKAVNGRNTDVEDNALYGIRTFIEHNKLPEDKVENVLSLFMKDVTDELTVTRKNAILSGIFKLMKEYELPMERIGEVFCLLMIMSKDIDADIRANALFGIGYILSIDNASSVENIDEVVDLLIDRANDAVIHVRANALFGINILIKENKLSIEKTKNILDLLIRMAKETDVDISNVALIGIIELMKLNSSYIEKISEILDLFITLSKHGYDNIRLKVFFGIDELLEKDLLSIEEIDNIFKLLVEGARDVNAKVSNNALFGIIELIEKDKLSIEMLKIALDLFVTRASDNDAIINSLWGICNLIKKEKIAINMLDDVLAILEERGQELFNNNKKYGEQLSEIIIVQKAIAEIFEQLRNIKEYKFITQLQDARTSSDYTKNKVEGDGLISDSSSIVPVKSDDLEKLSEEIAYAVLVRAKLLLKATELEGNNIELEKKFINELAILFRVSHRKLLESVNLNRDLKSNLIKRLAAELKKSGKLYIESKKFFINEELREDSREFLNPLISKVKEILKADVYTDSMNNVLEIRYVNDIIYDNPMLNNGELFRLISQKYGVLVVNKLIDIGANEQAYSEFLYNMEVNGIENAVYKAIGGRSYVDVPSEKPFSINQLTKASFMVKETIEALPIIKYFFKEILHFPISLPEFIDNHYVKMAIHYTACNFGVYSVTGRIDLYSTSLSTAIYSGKTLVYEYLVQQRQKVLQGSENTSIDSRIEFNEKCNFNMMVQVVFGSLSSVISGTPVVYDIAISTTVGSLQCYTICNKAEKPVYGLSTAEVAIPYVVDLLTLFITAKNMHLNLNTQADQMIAIKQGFMVISSVVMADYITKLLLDAGYEKTIGYVNSTYNYVSDNVADIIGRSSSLDYFSKEGNIEF